MLTLFNVWKLYVKVEGTPASTGQAVYSQANEKLEVSMCMRVKFTQEELTVECLAAVGILERRFLCTISSD